MHLPHAQELYRELEAARKALVSEQQEKQAALEQYWDATLNLEAAQKQLQDLAASSNAASTTSQICTKV